MSFSCGIENLVFVGEQVKVIIILGVKVSEEINPKGFLQVKSLRNHNSILVEYSQTHVLLRL